MIKKYELYSGYGSKARFLASTDAETWQAARAIFARNHAGAGYCTMYEHKPSKFGGFRSDRKEYNLRLR